MSWTVYMLKCADGTLYTGIAKDLKSRIAQHEAGLGAKYTRGRKPLELVYTEATATRGDALKRERQIKALDRTSKLELVDSTPLQPIA